ncbi:MAG: hypothetical protein ACI9LM_005555, partial [Alteromonadaceae bacterium]
VFKFNRFFKPTSYIKFKRLRIGRSVSGILLLLFGLIKGACVFEK